MEANATDIAPFIEAETAAADVQKNLAEGANNLSIAQRIEKGAYESGSCADLQTAAGYYFEAAEFFLRANRFSTVNAIVLHKDHLQRIIDEARAKGRCSRPLTARRPAPIAEPTPAVKQLPPDQCKTLFDTMRRIHEGIKKARQGGSREHAAHIVELAATACLDHNIVRPTSSECDSAKIHWHHINHVPLDEIERRLKAAGCPGA